MTGFLVTSIRKNSGVTKAESFTDITSEHKPMTKSFNKLITGWGSTKSVNDINLVSFPDQNAATASICASNYPKIAFMRMAIKVLHTSVLYDHI